MGALACVRAYRPIGRRTSVAERGATTGRLIERRREVRMENITPPHRAIVVGRLGRVLVGGPRVGVGLFGREVSGEVVEMCFGALGWSARDAFWRFLVERL